MADAAADEGSARDADAALLAGAVAGDQRAWRHVSDAHLDPVYGLARRMLRDAAEAEDVAQEAFLRLWQAAPRWRPEARIGTWLYRVTHNLCIDRLRRRRGVALDEAGEVEDERPGAEDLLQDRARVRSVEITWSPAGKAGLPWVWSRW